MSVPEQSDRLDAAARLDALPFTRLHAAIMAVCALGLVFDVVELGLGNALSAVFSAPPQQVSPLALSLLLASVFAGGAIGAPVLGWLGDRNGRQQTLSVTLVVLAATSIGAAASPDVTWLTFFRFLSGIAVGAYPPLIVAYLSDVLPPARRGMLILIVGGIGFLGAPLVIFLVRWLTPLQPLGLEGWRWALVLGAIGAAGIAVLLRSLPESPRWLLAAGRRAEAEAVCRRFESAAGLGPPAGLAQPREPGAGAGHEPAPQSADGANGRSRESFWSSTAGRVHRQRAALIGVLYFLSPWATIGFPLLSGAVLVEKGFRVADSLLYVGVAMFGPTLGSLAASLAIDRIERRTAVVLCAGIMAVAGMVFGVTTAPAALLAAGIVFNLVSAVYISTASVYTAELFPTRLRASITASGWAVNRVSSTLVPLALLPLLKTGGPVAMLAVIAAILVAIGVMLMAFGPRGLAGRPVT